jgi:hypothetical protein
VALPTSEDAVAEAEAQLGRRLPDELRRRLMGENGGDVRLIGEHAADEDDYFGLFPVRDSSSQETIRRTAYDILKENASAHEWPRFPADGIAIAHDDGGNLLFLDAANRVCLFLHETAETYPVEVEWDV